MFRLPPKVRTQLHLLRGCNKQPGLLSPRCNVKRASQFRHSRRRVSTPGRRQELECVLQQLWTQHARTVRAHSWRRATSQAPWQAFCAGCTLYKASTFHGLPAAAYLPPCWRPARALSAAGTVLLMRRAAMVSIGMAAPTCMHSGGLDCWLQAAKMECMHGHNGQQNTHLSPRPQARASLRWLPPGTPACQHHLLGSGRGSSHGR